MPTKDQKEAGRRAYKTEWARKDYANRSPAEKKIKSEAVGERIRNSPEKRPHRNALWLQAWRRRKAAKLKSNAINDLGSDTPTRAKSEVWTYRRNKKVRDAVLNRAGGKCEYCAELGFIKRNGKPYLETHHVIALASDGADNLTNVIALCPSDHREAHFGKRSREIEKEMTEKLRAMNR